MRKNDGRDGAGTSDPVRREIGGGGSIIELVVAVGILAAACRIASYFAGSSGNSALWVLGFLVGAVLAMGALAAVARLGLFYYSYRPIRPMCKNGKCRCDDYTLEPRDHLTLATCKCGTRYVTDGLRFMELRDDGSRRPFMKRRTWLCPWEPDLT